MDSETRHDVLGRLKQYAGELGRAPKRDDLLDCPYLTKHEVNKAFGTFTEAIKAAGFFSKKAKEVPKKFKYVPKKLESIVIHEADLKEWFEEAGNPPTLKVTVQPDTHRKHMDFYAMGVFLEFLEDYDPHAHIILGDFLDAEGISHWPSSSLEPRRFIPEVKEGRSLLEEIEAATPSCKRRIYLEGNHEDWINQALVARLPEMMDGIDELGLKPDLKALLDLTGFGYDLIPINHIFRLGKANFTHGYYTTDNHGKKHLDKLKGNIFYGHLHDEKGWSDSSMDGTISAQSFGCLCRLDAKFLKGKINNWVHGFGTFEFFPDGSFTHVFHRIKNGRLSYNGKVYGG